MAFVMFEHQGELDATSYSLPFLVFIYDLIQFPHFAERSVMFAHF
jgi:hypothetical protein